MYIDKGISWVRVLAIFQRVSEIKIYYFEIYDKILARRGRRQNTISYKLVVTYDVVIGDQGNGCGCRSSAY